MQSWIGSIWDQSRVNMAKSLKQGLKWIGLDISKGPVEFNLRIICKSRHRIESRLDKQYG